MALITAAQFREHYGQLNGTAEDTLIDTLITRVDALLALYCGYPVPDAGARTLEDTTYTLYLDGPSYRSELAIDLGVRPIVSVTSAHIDTEWTYDSTTEVASGDRVLDPSGTLWLTPASGLAWVDSPRANKVVVVAGYVTTPPDLVALTAACVRHLFDMRRTQGRAGIQLGGDQETYSDATALIPESVRRQLGPYVLWGSRAA